MFLFTEDVLVNLVGQYSTTLGRNLAIDTAAPTVSVADVLVGHALGFSPLFQISCEFVTVHYLLFGLARNIPTSVSIAPANSALENSTSPPKCN